MSRALGGFELLVLLALLHIDEESYGVPIRREIEDRTGREASTGALYTTLERLERRGLLSCRLGDPTPARGGRRRKLYTLAPAGLEALRESYGAFTTMVQGVEPLLRLADAPDGGRP
jgi:PadR family transcriptional regulator